MPVVDIPAAVCIPKCGSQVTRARSMALFFALGSACFLIAPLPGYLQLVGESADSATFFIGSILFTSGGALQCWLAWADRRGPGAGRAAWWSALIQSAGTVFFNVTTFRAMQTAVSSQQYDRLVWRPDAFGSICFLVSGVIAYHASSRQGWLPVRNGEGWWQPAANLLGCIFFGIAAVAGYVVPSTGSILGLAAANWNTCLGAACFLSCALAGLRAGRSSYDAAIPQAGVPRPRSLARPSPGGLARPGRHANPAERSD